MSNLFSVFFTGMFISFLGALPLGSLNISAMQVAATENIKNAILFSLGVALVEILYVRLSLQGIHWIIANQLFFTILEWMTVLLFIIMGVSSLRAAAKKNATQKNILLNNNMSRFWLGFTMSAINPAQVPFWFIWSSYLLSTKVLLPVTLHFNVYTAGIGIGTLAGLAVFIFAGRWLLQALHAGNRVINIIVGLVFLISAAIQLYRVVYRPFNRQLTPKTAMVATAIAHNEKNCSDFSVHDRY